MFGINKPILGQLKLTLMARFSMTDLGDVSLVLGINVTHARSKWVIRIHQTDSTHCILDRFNMKVSNPVSTPSTGAGLSC